MKGWSVVVVLLAALALTSALSKKATKKATADTHKKHIAEIEEKLEHLMELEAELESEIAEAEEVEESSDEENEVVEEEEQLLEEEEQPLEEEEHPLEEEQQPLEEEQQPLEEEQQPLEEEQQPLEEGEEEEFPEFIGDPCAELYCGAGRMCVVNDMGEGECRCVNACDQEVDPRRRVCSNINETWMSDCELYRQRCLCEDGDDSCINTEYAHAHIDYFGECQEMPVCEENELEDFPRRLSEWLFNIMRDMADRQILSEHYTRMEREAEENISKQWPYAVVWKWCQLDSHPKDSIVSRHELFPVRAPLFTLEHCIGTFLDSCDANDDHSITIQEWAKCTQLSEDQFDQLENLCEDIRDE